MQTSQMFEQCKRQFLDDIAKLQLLCEGSSSSPGDIEQFQKLISHARLLVKHISVQLCSLSSRKSKEINQQLKPFKDRLRFFEKKLEIINNLNLINQQQNTPKENTNLTLKQLDENDKLSECKKLLFEMEDISADVSHNLLAQTQKMQNSKATLLDTDRLISKANTLIDSMIARENRRRNVACLTVFAAILIVGGLKYCCY